MTGEANSVGSTEFFSVVHWNVQGIVGKLDEIHLLNVKHGTDIFCICEHWLSDEEINDISLPGYYLASSYCRGSGRRGGVDIFVVLALFVKSLVI